jgi:sulfur-carrier protein
MIFHIPGPLREFAEGYSQIEIDAAPGALSEALAALWSRCPGLRDRVLTEQGELRAHINLFVGNENTRYTGGLATPVTHASIISIIPAISGGNANPARLAAAVETER